MCVKLADVDWWKTEFIVLEDGKISYRGTGGDQERYIVNKDKSVYLNFMTGKGKYDSFCSVYDGSVWRRNESADAVRGCFM